MENNLESVYKMEMEAEKMVKAVNFLFNMHFNYILNIPIIGGGMPF